MEDQEAPLAANGERLLPLGGNHGNKREMHYRLPWRRATVRHEIVATSPLFAAEGQSDCEGRSIADKGKVPPVDETGANWRHCMRAEVGRTEARYESEALDGLPRAIQFLVWFWYARLACIEACDRSASGIDGYTEHMVRSA